MPSDIECDTAHLLLVRYVVTKGLSDMQGRKMAQTVIRNSVFFGGSREVRDAQKFMECLSQARENPRRYCWNCEDIWSCKRLRERPACTGWNCEYYQARPIKEPNYERSEDQASMEEDILTYLLNDPDSVTEALRLGLRSEGFADEYVSRGGIRLPFNRLLWHACRYLAYHDRQIRYSAILSLFSRSPEMRPHVNEIARYVQRLRNRASCKRDTFIKYLNLTNARGARLRAQELVQMAETALASGTLPLEIVLRTLRDQSNTLLFEASDKTPTFEEDLDFFVSNLFAKRREVIPTPSEWLNIAFGGGWKPGKLYAVTGCDTEATDFIAWCADFAAQNRFPTLYVSYGMSKEHFAERALARRSGIDETELSRYRENVFDAEADETTLERVIEAGERLSRGAARYLTVVEANEETTIAAVRSALRMAQNQVDANQGGSMLIILDRLPRASTNARRLTDSVRTSSTFDESSLLTDLKRHLQDFAVAIVAVVVGNKTPNAQSSGNDEAPIKPSPRNLKGSYGADYTLALHSADTIMKSTASEKTADQLHLAQEWYKRNLSQCRGRVERLFEEAAGNYPLDETCAYTRISLFGRDAKVFANPVIIYEWPYHRFRTLDVEPMSLEKHNRLSFDEH
ncbi:MAG: hypothetical protein ABR979_02240 [Halobacteriota archaeon]